MIWHGPLTPIGLGFGFGCADMGVLFSVITPLNAQSSSPTMPWVFILGLCLLACVVILLRVRSSVRMMHRQHQDVLHKLADRQNELEASLDSMVEAVLAISPSNHLITLNEAAAHLFGTTSSTAVGRLIHDVIHIESLRQFIAQIQQVDRPLQTDIAWTTETPAADDPPEPRMFLAQGAILRDASGNRTGSLIVLHDVTRLRRLEVIRRDFVSNASHEIKTPVAAIKAAGETLRDAHDQDEETRYRFLDIICRQTQRLEAIIEDMLCLARLEEEAETRAIERTRAPIASVLHLAAEACQVHADERHTRLHLEVSETLRVLMNQQLIEQAAVNLIENAIKYSAPESRVWISAERQGDYVVIAVRDEGTGIAAEHLPRLFERFYRTDKARSRALGGTGLGLSIVKHVALAHGGRVSVNSTPGHGSVFRIHLPTA